MGPWLVKGTKDPMKEEHILFVVFEIINMVNGASK